MGTFVTLHVGSSQTHEVFVPHAHLERNSRYKAHQCSETTTKDCVNFPFVTHLRNKCNISNTWIRSYQAHKTLGHPKEPAGSTQFTQYTKLKAKSTQTTMFLWTTALSWDKTWLFYNACYLPAVQYPLTWSYINKLQLDKIQRKAMLIIISRRSGYNQCTKKDISSYMHHYNMEEQDFIIFISTVKVPNKIISSTALETTLTNWQNVKERVCCHGHRSQSEYFIPWWRWHTNPCLTWRRDGWHHYAISYPQYTLAYMSTIPAFHQHNVKTINILWIWLYQPSKLFSKTENRKLNYCPLFLQCVEKSG